MQTNPDHTNWECKGEIECFVIVYTWICKIWCKEEEILEVKPRPEIYLIVQKTSTTANASQTDKSKSLIERLLKLKGDDWSTFKKGNKTEYTTNLCKIELI